MLIPFLGTLNIRCPIRIGIQKGTIILIATHIIIIVNTITNNAHIPSLTASK